MMKLLIIIILSGTMAFASPAKEMNTAFNALVNIIPYTQSFETFSAKENEDLILKNMTTIQSAFKKAKHENLLKQDIFAPSYEMINENITSSIDSKKGKSLTLIGELKRLLRFVLIAIPECPPHMCRALKQNIIQ